MTVPCVTLGLIAGGTLGSCEESTFMDHNDMSPQLLQAAQDPHTDAEYLRRLAYYYPALRPHIACNPAAYEGLLQWLADNGVQEATQALEARSTERPALAVEEPSGSFNEAKEEPEEGTELITPFVVSMREDTHDTESSEHLAPSEVSQSDQGHALDTAEVDLTPEDQQSPPEHGRHGVTPVADEDQTSWNAAEASSTALPEGKHVALPQRIAENTDTAEDLHTDTVLATQDAPETAPERLTVAAPVDVAEDPTATQVLPAASIFPATTTYSHWQSSLTEVFEAPVPTTAGFTAVAEEAREARREVKEPSGGVPRPQSVASQKEWTTIVITVLAVLTVILAIAIMLLYTGVISISGSRQSAPEPVALTSSSSVGESIPQDTPSPAPSSSTPSETPSPSESPITYPAPAGAIEGNGFDTPSHNIMCRMGADQVTCTVVASEWTAQNRDQCSADPQTLTLTEGNVALDCGNPAADGGSQLDYNQTMTQGDMACSVTLDGVSCWNIRSGQSFAIAKRGWLPGTSGRIEPTVIP